METQEGISPSSSSRPPSPETRSKTKQETLNNCSSVSLLGCGSPNQDASRANLTIPKQADKSTAGTLKPRNDERLTNGKSKQFTTQTKGKPCDHLNRCKTNTCQNSTSPNKTQDIRNRGELAKSSKSNQQQPPTLKKGKRKRKNRETITSGPVSGKGTKLS